jgi:hypothetical protein
MGRAASGRAPDLLVLRVLRAHDVDLALAEDDGAAVAHRLHRRADLHATCECRRRARDVRVRVCVRARERGEARARQERPAEREQRAEHGWRWREGGRVPIA